MLELTPAGLRTLAAQLGLSLASAIAHHGLAGGGPESPIGTRRILLAHLDHTVGGRRGLWCAGARGACATRRCVGGVAQRGRLRSWALEARRVRSIPSGPTRIRLLPGV